MSRATFTAKLYATTLVGFVVLFSIAVPALMAFNQSGISRSENRVLARLPEWPRSPAEWETFPQRFEAYFNDNFGLRTLMLRLHTNFSTVMLGRLPSNRVIEGKDEWLFFAGDQAIDQYRNRRPLSPVQLDDTRDALLRRMRQAAALNARYLFIVVPDKHNIYPEKMPSLLTRSERPSQLDQVIAVAKSANVPMLDLRPAMLAGKFEGGLVYFKDDTHWTDWGAYLAYRAVIAAQPLPDVPLLEMNFGQFTVRSGFAGELARMSNLPWVEPSLSAVASADRCRLDATGPTEVNISVVVARSKCAGAKYKVVYIGDSFTHRIRRYVGQSFGEVAFVIRSAFLPFSQLQPYVDNEAPDLIIEELVERHLPTVAESVAREN